MNEGSIDPVSFLSWNCCTGITSHMHYNLFAKLFGKSHRKQYWEPEFSTWDCWNKCWFMPRTELYVPRQKNEVSVWTLAEAVSKTLCLVKPRYRLFLHMHEYELDISLMRTWSWKKLVRKYSPGRRSWALSQEENIFILYSYFCVYVTFWKTKNERKKETD